MTAVIASTLTIDAAELIKAHAAIGATPAACRGRRYVGLRFVEQFGSLHGWLGLPVAERLEQPVVFRSWANWAVVEAMVPVDAGYVVGASAKWALHVTEREPLAHAEFTAAAAALGFSALQTRHMWAALAKLAVIAGCRAATIADRFYLETRDIYLDAIRTRCDGTIPKIFATPVFGLNAVMFHLGRGPAPGRPPGDGAGVHEVPDLQGSGFVFAAVADVVPAGPARLPGAPAQHVGTEARGEDEFSGDLAVLGVGEGHCRGVCRR